LALMRWCFEMYNNKPLEELFNIALDAVKAKNVVKNNICCDEKNLYVVDQKIPLKSFKNLYIFSVGKAAYEMAKTAEEIFGDKIYKGLAISLSDQKLQFQDTYQSTHPIVSKKSFQAADKLINLAKELDEDDFFLFFLSGGASALIEKPIDGLSLKEFQKISKALITSGIDIKAMNKVRKSISLIKGGKLANDFKASGHVLVLSDVVGDDLSSIGSAPMYDKVDHTIIGNNTIALKEAKKHIKNKVEKCKILTTTLQLSSAKAASYLSQKIKKYDQKYDSYCLLVGGETTLKVKGSGLGGRNSELALRLVIQNCIGKDTAILCAGSDGVDGSSPANGAFMDSEIYTKIKKKKLDPKIYLKNNDSYSFFKELGYEFHTGITGTNVMDFVFILKKKK
jgi:glycerate 2-kinase